MEPKTTKKPSRKLVVFKRELPFYLMLIPGVTFLIIFSYLPIVALQKNKKQIENRTEK